MNKISKEELIKIGSVAIFGLVALFVMIIWLKGHKLSNFDKYTFYFRNINGLQEGNALRWNGLKVGVVESVHPVRRSFVQESLPVEALLSLGKRHLQQAQKTLSSPEIEDLVIAQEEVRKAQLEIALAKESCGQNEIIEGKYVSVTVSVTTPNLPIGPLNQVTIVPSGVIGEQYVDITTIDIDEEFAKQFNTNYPRFIVQEPVRLDTLIRLNAESSEAVSNLANRLNAIFTDQDADHLRTLIVSSGKIAADEAFKEDLKETVKNLNHITSDFNFWSFIVPHYKKDSCKNK